MIDKYQGKQDERCVVRLTRQSPTLRINVPNLLRRGTRDYMVGLEEVSIGKSVERNSSEKIWYKRQPEAVIENKTCNVFWIFTKQTDHFMIARMSYLIIC